MYGTLSFGKGDKCSSAEFHAVSAAHSKRQRQPACDACKTARVKCRSSANGDKCGRCRGRNRPCTYKATRRQSRHLNVSSDLAESTAGKPNIGDASPHTPLVPESVSSSPQRDSPPPPLLQPADGAQWWDSHPDCLFEPFDFMVDSELRDGGTTGLQHRTAASNQELEGATSPVDPAAVHHNMPDNYDFSAYYYQLTPRQRSFSKLLPTSTCTTAWGDADGQQDENTRPAVSSPASPSLGTQVKQLQQPKIDSMQTSSLIGVSDLTDVMQFAKGKPLASMTPASDPCTCLQDLTASLFSLRNGAESTTQVDGFLVMFRQAMRRWEVVVACPLACCGLRSFALLLLMNVQELVALLLEIASTLSGGAKDSSRNRDSVPAINVGTFTVDDEADQGIIAHIILAARMKELQSFIARISSKMELAGLDDVCTELKVQIKTLRGAFMT